MKKYDNYMSNLSILKKAKDQDLSNEFIIGGIVDKFYVQFELAWKMLKELLKYEGRVEAATGSPRTIIKTAYAVYDFIDEETWLKMLDDRNDLSHQYDGELAAELADRVISTYIPLFEKIGRAVVDRYGDVLESI
ncbi:MAG: nucleotidyltransferase substrate binding protein [Eubacterium sp.]|nr:nucleotidyltransferase substrate binding protein [Eubacterium sp.]